MISATSSSSRLGQISDEGSAADAPADEAVLLENAKGLAHGGARTAERGGELALGRQPFTIEIDAVDDRLAHIGGDARGAAHGPGHDVGRRQERFSAHGHCSTS